MTAYFDEKHKKLIAIWFDDHAALRVFDEEIVWDVTLAAESPGMPEDLRDEIHRTVLKHSVACQPLLPEGKYNQGPDPQNGEDHKRILNELVWHLHTVFHEVARRGVDNFSDSPLSPLRVLNAQGDERREKMAAEALKP